MTDIGVITFHCADNYGAVLQAHGLQIALKKMGYGSEVIDYRPYGLIEPYAVKINYSEYFKRHGLLSTLKKNVTQYKNLKQKKEKARLFSEYRKENLRISKKVFFTSEELKKNPPIYQAYIAGSDQVWNPTLIENQKLGLSYFLDFAPNDSKKISYAASIAEKEKEGWDKLFENNLSDFDHISIREEGHQKFIESVTKRDVEIVLDPCLLLEKKDWAQFMKNNYINHKFILVYDLENNDKLIPIVNKIAKEKNLKVISFSDNKKYINRIETFKYKGPAELLSYIENAEFIITNSFHGTAFSIIFEKEFYTVPHSNRGVRMIDLLNTIGLKERIIYDVNDIEFSKKNIDYEKTNRLLSIRKNESLSYLKNSLI